MLPKLRDTVLPLREQPPTVRTKRLAWFYELFDQLRTLIEHKVYGLV